MKRIFQPLLAMLLCLSLCLPVMATDNQALAAKDVVSDIARETDSEVNIGESEDVSGDAGEETAPDEGEDLPGESGGEQDSVEAVKFPFTVYLKDADGNPLVGAYSYESRVKNSEEVTTGTISNGDVIYLTDKSYIDIFGLPEGTRYEVVEGETEGYSLDSSSNTVGMIATDTISHAKFVNRENTGEHFIDRLPETGGEGVWGIVCVGASFITLGGCLYLTKKEI